MQFAWAAWGIQHDVLLVAVFAMMTDLQAHGLSPQAGVLLSQYTSFRIGGPADILVVAHTADDLAAAVSAAERHGQPWWILGGGSNLLVSDEGVRGLTILNRCRAVELCADHHVRAESGVLLAGLARETIQAGLTGLEWAVSVPGTVGGAVVGNAGAHGGSIADSLLSIDVLHSDGRREPLPATELGFAYRSSGLKAGRVTGVVLSALFRLAPGLVEEMKQRAAGYLAHRRRTQPVEASAGSIFRNPPGDYAGRLIEAAGLKGTQEGQAQFSPVHANFIVNLGGATAADVRRLIERAEQGVWERFGIKLELEILVKGG
jgi:UDP-N-acetylmuramate dehydrogenase